MISNKSTCITINRIPQHHSTSPLILWAACSCYLNEPILFTKRVLKGETKRLLPAFTGPPDPNGSNNVDSCSQCIKTSIFASVCVSFIMSGFLLLSKIALHCAVSTERCRGFKAATTDGNKFFHKHDFLFCAG